jgi:hypothetical protein
MTRVDANTLEVRVLGHGADLDRSVIGSYTRHATDPIRVGDHFEVSGMQVDVLALTAGQPVRMRFRFDVPLEDPSLLFLQTTRAGLRRLPLPLPGETRLLPKPPSPDARDIERFSHATVMPAPLAPPQ